MGNLISDVYILDQIQRRRKELVGVGIQPSEVPKLIVKRIGDLLVVERVARSRSIPRQLHHFNGESNVKSFTPA